MFIRKKYLFEFEIGGVKFQDSISADTYKAATGLLKFAHNIKSFKLLEIQILKESK